MDKIEIRDLEIFANHGVFPEETALGQKFVVSAVTACKKNQKFFKFFLAFQENRC